MGKYFDEAVRVISTMPKTRITHPTNDTYENTKDEGIVNFSWEKSFEIRELDFTAVSHDRVNTPPEGLKNGCDKHTFVFDRDISEDEFIAYLDKDNYRLLKYIASFLDYAIVSGGGNKWCYTHSYMEDVNTFPDYE